MSKQKFYIIISIIIALLFTTKAFAALTFGGSAITGDTASTIDISSGGGGLYLQTSGGNVGIGTTNPTATLHIVAIPSTIGYVTGVGSTYYPANILSINDTVVPPGTRAGNLIDYIVNPPSNPGSRNYYGQKIALSTPSSNAQSMTSANLTGDVLDVNHQGSGNIGSLTGINSTATLSGNGNATNVFGIFGAATVTGSGNVSSAATGLSGTVTITNGTVANARGEYSTIVNTSAGTITNLSGNNITIVSTKGTITNTYGYLFNDFTNQGIVTNTYGVYIGSLTSGTQTHTPYSFYASDAGAYNYFAGNVGIGTTAPAYILHIEPSGITGDVVARVRNSADPTGRAFVQAVNDQGKNASMKAYGSTYVGTWAGINAAGAAEFSGGTNPSAVFFGASSGNPIYIGQQNATVPAISIPTGGNGNVGIGTTSAVSRLTVAGAISNGVTTATNSDNRGHITLVAGTGSYTFTQGPGAAGVWTTAPVCIIQDDTTLANIATSTKTVTASTLTITGSVGTTDTYSYICWPGN